MACGLSDKAMKGLLTAEIDMHHVAMVGTWHLKVRGNQVVSSTLWYEGDEFVTYDVEINNVNLFDLSMTRPQFKLQAV